MLNRYLGYVLPGIKMEIGASHVNKITVSRLAIFDKIGCNFKDGTS